MSKELEECYQRRREKVQKTKKFLTRNAEKAMYKYINIIRNEIKELQITQYYDLIYVKTKELG